MVKQHRATRVKSMSAKAISDILARSAAVKLATAERCSDAAFEASRMIATALESGGKIMICGNGGSAADAQHLAAELSGKFIINNFKKDHRVFMMSCIAALTLGGKWKIYDKDSINSSFPKFLKLIKKLGAKIN